MEENLSDFKKNIISWYPINEKDTVLQIGEDKEILQELKLKSNNVAVIDNIEEFTLKAKFDYVTMIGSFEKLETEEQIINLLEFGKKF